MSIATFLSGTAVQQSFLAEGCAGGVKDKADMLHLDAQAMRCGFIRFEAPSRR